MVGKGKAFSFTSFSFLGVGEWLVGWLVVWFDIAFSDTLEFLVSWSIAVLVVSFLVCICIEERLGY